MQRHPILAALSLLLFCISTANAEPLPLFEPNAPGKYNSDKFFAGINWTFGAGPSVGPEAVLGFRSTRVKPGSVRGHGIEFTFPLAGGPQFGAVKLKAISGDRHLQGELGLGYSFLMGAPLLTGGGFGEHVMFGTDYVFGDGNGFRPYIGLHTLSSYRKPSTNRTALLCDPQFNPQCDPLQNGDFPLFP